MEDLTYLAGASFSPPLSPLLKELEEKEREFSEMREALTWERRSREELEGKVREREKSWAEMATRMRSIEMERVEERKEREIIVTRVSEAEERERQAVSNLESLQRSSSLLSQELQMEVSSEYLSITFK